MLNHPIEKQNCIVCNTEFNFVTPTFENNQCKKQPEPGNVSLCIECANIAIFDENMKLRQPTPEEERQILKSQNIIDSIDMIILVLEIRKLKFKHGYGNL